MTEEVSFQENERTWERVAVIVSGTPELAHEPATEVVAADPHGVGVIGATSMSFESSDSPAEPTLSHSLHSVMTDEPCGVARLRPRR
jgi:hypothetical protein